MTEAQAFFTGDRVKFRDGSRNGYKTGTVVGDIFWGPDDHRFIVVFDQGGQEECIYGLLTRM